VTDECLIAQYTPSIVTRSDSCTALGGWFPLEMALGALLRALLSLSTGTCSACCLPRYVRGLAKPLGDMCNFAATSQQGY